VNTALLYANYSATGEPTSHYFCGNNRKSPPGAPCMSKAFGPSGNRLAATERVEIRGWVIASQVAEWGFGDANNSEGVPEEYLFDVLLDHGWTPATPADANVFALNTEPAPYGAGSRLFKPWGKILEYLRGGGTAGYGGPADSGAAGPADSGAAGPADSGAPWHRSPKSAPHCRFSERN
jgi:hypothetical protein